MPTRTGGKRHPLGSAAAMIGKTAHGSEHRCAKTIQIGFSSSRAADGHEQRPGLGSRRVARGKPPQKEIDAAGICGCHTDRRASVAALPKSCQWRGRLLEKFEARACAACTRTFSSRFDSAAGWITKNGLSLIRQRKRDFRRRNVSRETGLTLPESRSSIRRAISSLQAASTASGSSWVSSRLSSREPANSARSSSLRARARFNSSVASCVMRSLYARSQDAGQRLPDGKRWTGIGRR